MEVKQIIVFNKKTQKYYHPKSKKWLDYEPEYGINSINKIYFDYDHRTKKNQLNKFKGFDVKDLEIVQRTFTIVKKVDNKLNASSIFNNRKQFHEYQDAFGFMLPDFIKGLHDKNQLNHYKYIARLSDKSNVNALGMTYVWLNSDSAREILSKLKKQGIKRTDVKFRNPLIALETEEQLMTLKLVAGENIYCFDNIKPIANAWLAMNILK